MTRGSAAPTADTGQDGTVELRALTSPRDLAACVRLQRDTWGADYVDTVPASVLKVSQMVGGITGGAFTEAGELVGFVFGLTGIRDGRLTHWSHMLAVREEYRDGGLGRRLKQFQKEAARALGVELICWTFDPLVARNAHLNLNHLGSTVSEYVPDMYGETGSGLHAFGTDRFVVTWNVDGGTAPVAGVPPSWRTAPLSVGGDDAEVRIEIPQDVTALPNMEARSWRARTRPAFVRLLGDGYRVAGFYRDESDRCYYVLNRESDT
jgi:predicted GNAT superfamily acetyltransferase